VVKARAEAGLAVRQSRAGDWLVIVMVVLMLAGLSLAAWLDISSLSQSLLQRQASDLSSIITRIS